jgi:hypothetical protein
MIKYQVTDDKDNDSIRTKTTILYELTDDKDNGDCDDNTGLEEVGGAGGLG